MAITDNIFACYEFNETSGTVANDETGTYDGTVSGGTTINQTGILDKAYDFDGTLDYVVTPQFMEGSTSGTVSIWCKSDVTTGYTSAAGQDEVFRIGNNNNGTWDAYFHLTGGRVTVTGGSVSTDWTHFAVTYDGQTVTLYEDGSAVDAASGSTALQTKTFIQAIGALNHGSLNWNGLVDQTAFWGRCLDSSEISQIYNGGSGLAYPWPQDVTVNIGSALSLSTSEQAPTITVSQGFLNPLSLAVGLKNPDIEGVNVTPNTGTVTVGSGTVGSKFINTNYPVTEGLIAGTTKHPKKVNL